jgi:2-polyprenyl-6-methoxyphenol hydroxylase-like FAD-dependent oxidoreductase
MRIVVVGGGPGGLGAAVPLAAAGHEVTVLDRDPAPPDSDDDAWTSWQRRSVAQMRQPHFFLARLWKELSETAPGLRAELEGCEPAVARFVERLPPTATDRDPLPGDEELVAMGFRRPTFERALRRWVTTQPNLTLRCGVEVKGLVADDDARVPRVTGVALADGSTIDADLVVCATGRHGAATRWLAEIGGGPVEEDEADGGLAYFSRYYRMAPGATAPKQYGGLVVDAGSILVFTFPADHGTFTLAATPLSDDKPMRRLKDNDAFDRVMRTIPRTAAWLDDTGAVAINDVGVLARIEDRRRRMVVDGRPAALGVVLCADAALCTNPVLGRGTSIAWVAGRRLAEVVAEHGDDLEKLALAFDEVTERELRPWYEDSLATDRQRFAVMRALANGEPRPEPDPSDIGATMGAAMQFAGGYDGIVFRAGARRFNLLDPLDAIMSNTDAITRAIDIWERRASLPAPPPMPSRDEVLAALAG